MKFFFLSLFLLRIECESNSMGEVQNFEQFFTLNEEANKSISNTRIVIYFILFIPSHNVSWDLLIKAKFWQHTTLYESPKIEMLIKCFKIKSFPLVKHWIRSIIQNTLFQGRVNLKRKLPNRSMWHTHTDLRI